MTAHISDELPRLLTGEANRDSVLTAAAHLRTCIDCQQELVSAVVGHASLTSAQRFAPEIVSGRFAGVSNLAEAAEALDSIDDDVDASTDEPSVPSSSLPDLSTVFAQVRDEAANERSGAQHRRAGRARYGLVAAAAAVVVGGGVIGVVALTGNGSSPAGESVALSAFDVGTSPAKATVDGGEISIDAKSLPHLASAGYEVWLTDGQRVHMRPVGWISANGTADLNVPVSLVKRFSDIEVSVQKNDAASYRYSGTSVLRGAYA